MARELELEEFSSGVEPLAPGSSNAPGRKADGPPARACVVCQGKRVVGYYGLAAGSVPHHCTMAPVRRNMLNPVPAALLGRLALDQSWQGRGLGSALQRDGDLRFVGAAPSIGVRAIPIPAIWEKRSPFTSSGATALPVHPMPLMITIEEATRNCG